MHHAWLIVGPEGIGKATLAYHFARMVLAEASGRESLFQMGRLIAPSGGGRGQGVGHVGGGDAGQRGG